MTQEDIRIQEKNKKEKNWLKWGPYLSERQWGTVREDYSANGDAWNYTTYDQARSIAWRWGEDGIAGISDDQCNLCFSVALWNGKDNHIKERLFGLSNPQGNHGEDVKELYYYLENTPTHAYMKYLYKYPNKKFPYEKLIQENAQRDLNDLEFELPDTGAFKKNNYTDVYIEYAKADEEDLLIKISAANRSLKATDIHLLPQLFIKNEWDFIDIPYKPFIEEIDKRSVRIDHHKIGEYFFYFEEVDLLLFTENETNNRVINNASNDHPFKKDLFNDCLINNQLTTAKQTTKGTKFSPYSKFKLEGQTTKTFRFRLSKKPLENPFADFDPIFFQREHECEEFYRNLKLDLPENLYQIQKQAFAGLLWTKQFYHYNVEKWLEGDKQIPNPPSIRKETRNASWQHARNYDILLMPDKWEYPWYASWDSAFHVIAMAEIDIAFAKEQLLIFLKDWYMKPTGQIPAYEWNFDDVNPPVQPWAALILFQIEKRKTGKGDVSFLKKMFHKLTLNFTWWVNRLDPTENNVFEGGFLGMDNIGVFDRSKEIPGEASLEQVDGTAWMALYCLSMLKISLLISTEDGSYEDMAVKYFGHFVFIAESLNHIEEDLIGIWDKTDGFFYDKLVYPDGREEPVKVRSLVGMLAVIAVLEISKEIFDTLPNFKRSYEWFRVNRKGHLKFPVIQEGGDDEGILLSLVPKDRLDILLKALLDEKEFLSDYGIRSLSKMYEEPYMINLNQGDYSIQYTPAESDSDMFGGNSNWRGPIWFPMNHLLIDSLRELYKFYGDEAKYAFPTGSNNYLNLNDISDELSKRLIAIFDKDENNERPVNRLYSDLFKQEYFDDLITFYEYFHGDNGRGVGASHQTGWTALVANLILNLHHKDCNI
ncbi:glucosidase [Flavobacteriaceae bacterium Ap0902]|nr:glucosidase [Flavobacteriaceae bacterium Ap0902]